MNLKLTHLNDSIQVLFMHSSLTFQYIDLLDIYSFYFYHLLSPPGVNVSWMTLNILSECDEAAVRIVHHSQKFLWSKTHQSLPFQCSVSLLRDLNVAANTKGERSTVKKEDIGLVPCEIYLYCDYKEIITDYR